MYDSRTTIEKCFPYISCEKAQDGSDYWIRIYQQTPVRLNKEQTDLVMKILRAAMTSTARNMQASLRELLGIDDGR